MHKETFEQEKKRYEKIKQDVDFDEHLQHYYWIRYQRFVPLKDIENGPDDLLTTSTVKLNQRFVRSHKKASGAQKEKRDVRRKA